MSTLSWLDLKLFYIKIPKPRTIHDASFPESLILNHIPLDCDTLLEANGVRTRVYSDGVTTNLNRDRLDTRSEEVTFVCTDSIRTTGSVKFEVFQGDVLVLSGALELCRGNNNNNVYKCRDRGQVWRMDCEPNVGNRCPYKGKETAASSVEVYVAGCFSGCPIVLNMNLQIGPNKRKRIGKGMMLKSIPEEETIQILEDEPSTPAVELKPTSNEENNGDTIQRAVANLCDKGAELSWFNAGVRVGVGISLSICFGLGIGVGLLART